MDITDRIKHLRKTMGLTQDEFGKSLGVSRDVIGNIEYDRLKRPDQKEPLYRLICEKFNISDRWLRTGEGEMYTELPATLEVVEAFAALTKDDDPLTNELLLAVFKCMQELSERDYEPIKKYIKNAARIIREKEKAQDE